MGKLNFNRKLMTALCSLVLGVWLVTDTVSADSIPPQQRIQAARSTAEHNQSCSDITPFYWEIGDTRQRLAAASVGGSRPDANTPMKIASASKWWFGAYVEQLRNGKLSTEDIKALTMQSGYTNFKYHLCVKYRDRKQQKLTVNQCFEESGLLAGSNAQYDTNEDGKFHYNGGHFQSWAVQNGLGNMNNEELARAMRRQLGNELSLQFDSPQLAGGGYSTANTYARFLRKILAHELIIGAHLGDYAVCTNKLDCPGLASFSPVPDYLHWHYSLGHWVEDDPALGDGAFSSPGAFGFYPWIDSSKTWYGIVAREKKSVFEKVSIDSVMCGIEIRKAWMTGTEH